MYMYIVCVHSIYMYMYMYNYMYIVCAYTAVLPDVYMYIVHVHVYMIICVCVYGHTHIHMRIHTHAEYVHLFAYNQTFRLKAASSCYICTCMYYTGVHVQCILYTHVQCAWHCLATKFLWAYCEIGMGRLR